MPVCRCRRTSPAGSTCDKTELHKKRLAHILKRDRFLSYCGCKRFKSHGPAAVALYHHIEHTLVKAVEPERIYLKAVERDIRDIPGYFAVAHDLGKIPHALEKAVGYTRCAACTLCYLGGSLRIAGDPEYRCRTADYLRELICGIEFQTLYDTETVAQR